MIKNFKNILGKKKKKKKKPIQGTRGGFVSNIWHLKDSKLFSGEISCSNSWNVIMYFEGTSFFFFFFL